MKPIKRTFFTQPDVLHLSQQLLGQHLVTEVEGERCVGRIVEVEAYRYDDKACHAYGNKQTKRTEVMFREGGHAYVYLCYGIHHLFNIVSGKEGQAEAVLVRALEPMDNLASMLERRGMEKMQKRLTAGPGCLAQAMGIHTSMSGLDMLSGDSPVWIEAGDRLPSPSEIATGPRIGVDFAEECAAWPWRFAIKGNRWISKTI
ncbi:MAG: DNA-3-methyladenine glycosylase [Bacteroidetes bacterium]|nr:DNA-3-methyladenine glycosylase [Bacteroidota bacterium]